jgi:type VI secretion system protein ImpA
MDFLDLQPLRSPVSPEAPCGVDLENNNDPRWGQLNNLAAGEKREGITYPPKWKDVKELALELARETRHLRLGIILTECATFINGLPGLRDGLGLIRSWCENFWDNVYPAGELEDKRDFRPPVLEAINYPSFLVRMLAVPVSQSAGGRFSIGDLEASENPTPGDGDASNQAKLVQGGFKNTPIEILKTAHTALLEALDHAKTIESIFDNSFGSGYGVNLADLRDQLSRMAKKLAPFCGTVATPGDSEGADFGEGGAATFTGGGGIAVNSRDSAIRALDKVIDWFETNEPSNPVPFLLRRAQRCANMNFFELITELANDRAQAELILSPHATPSGGGEGS